jgi:crotonobetainyl-CoA:carnitine CoA-transferase CaiB-like acyl-CoA transferase
MLSPYRVLDLTDGRAELGPMILGDLGADVIKVEPPGGSPSRVQYPVDPLAPEGMASLAFQVFNRNKRSVALDFDGRDGREAFLRLVAGADFLFENERPGAMSARGLGFDDLAKVNPGLVYVATSPFGQDGPYAHHLATDITLAAMGGMMALNGDADRPPVRVSVPQCWYHAAAESAVGAMIAHQRRLATGEGQFVDVSVQTAVFWTGLNAMIAHAIQGSDIERNGSQLQLGTITLPVVYRCADGEVVLLANGASMPKVVPWMVREGVVPASWLTDEDWRTYDMRWIAGQPTIIPLPEAIERLEAFTRLHTKAALLARALAEGVTIAPVNTVADVVAFGHLHERGYWQNLRLSGGRTIHAPGPFVRMARTPIRYQRPAPVLGQHTVGVLDEPARRPALATMGTGAEPAPLPFEGLKVADFSWIGVGPITAKCLGDHGATVVRVETANPPDRLRVAGPFKDGQFGHNRSQFFGAFNTSKRSIALNLKEPAAREVAKRLIAWADVYLESFTPGTVKDLGLDYQVARQINPGIIMVSSCLMGQDGPAAPLAGYGNHAAAISGFYEVTGWPDRPPGGPFTAYTDTIAPHFLTAALAAALDHRRRTGEGQYIEQSQMESALYFLTPELLDCQVGGTVARRMGNASPDSAPHGAYPCAGNDEWCAIAVETDGQWQALRGALGSPGWMADPRFDSSGGRLMHRAEIDEKLAGLTRAFAPHSLMEKLQGAGVPAGAVQRSSDLLSDPQLAHREFFRPLRHTEMGEVPYEGHQFRIRGYDSGPRFASPGLGEHSLEVLQDVLGMTDEEIAQVATSGALV